MKKCRRLIDNQASISIRTQCRLLGLHRSGVYYHPVPESEQNLRLMRLLDERNLNYPAEGVLQLQDYLRTQGYPVNHKRIRRLIRKMGLMAIYPKRNLSRLGQAIYIRPYLLKGLAITACNQVWQIDITYVPMAKGFMYLVALLDVYSRYVTGWSLSNSMAAEWVVDTLQQAIARNGKPVIINSDQGSQFTCSKWVDCLEQEQIKISMDGKGRAIDNIYIERLWRTVKYDYIYLSPAGDGWELERGLANFFEHYNNRKCHQGLARKTPAEVYCTPLQVDVESENLN
ncbi:IS3 family transposase [Spirosoma endbachense]|uniref:IS3 family transposase n=1 Tax=Spirosoma endbachense TaxID=2666025 RepID=A0A6P1W9I6_9BACT|nr:IS3 family transposase [Spirosoma endbachense]QHW01063.1 IS3 family transposase [Spirosoma endbachense]